MNAHQRRIRRRRKGIRPPYRCLWCLTDLPTWDAPCPCKPLGRPRKLVGDMTVEQLARGAWERGLEFRFDIRPVEQEEVSHGQ